jgi:hypothetical protein
MTSIAHTQGPWLRFGRTVYAPMHAGWRKGEEQFKNRITITVQYDRECKLAEAVACACLAEASPDLLESSKAMISALEDLYCIGPEHSDDFIYDMLPSSGVATAYLAARASVRKATGGAA